MTVLTTLLAVVACSGPAATPTVVSVTIDDGGRSVTVGATLALTVTMVTRGGASEAVLWSSDAPDTATVSSAGVIMGVSPGEAGITATSALDASKSDTVTITVASPPLAPGVLSVSIDAGERSVLVGENLQLSATVTTVGEASEAVIWMSGDTGAATVDGAGWVSGVAAGEAWITAVSVVDATMSDSTLITVVSALPGAPARISVAAGNNQTAQAGSAVPVPPTVRVRDVDENPLPGVSVTFTVTAGSGAIAPSTPVTTNADGIATLSAWTLGNTAGANGVRATVTGSNPPISATFSATGVPGPASPQTSTVTANPTSLLANGTATSQITIQLKDAYGNDLTSGDAAVSFAAPSQGSIGAVTDNANGTYSATYTAGTAAGPVTITPRVSGVNFGNTTTITLTAAVISVTIDQPDLDLTTGDTTTLTATVVTIGGATAAVTWDSHHPNIATINPTTGLLTANNPGIATITATSLYAPTESDSLTVTVTATPTGNPIWNRTFSSEGEEEAAGLAVDANDNVILLFNTDHHVWAPHYGTGMVLAKLDPNGITQWYRQFGTSTNDRAGGVTTDPHGNIIVTGTTFGNLDGTNAGGGDAFIAKFDPDGYIQWYRQLGTPAQDEGTAIATDAQANILVGGTTTGELGGSNEQGRQQSFLTKHDTDGNRIWMRQSGLQLGESVGAVAVGPTGNTVMAGSYYKGATARNFDADGNETWSAGYYYYSSATGAAVDTTGHVLVTGSGVIESPTFPSVAFLARHFPDGTDAWTRALGPAEGSDGRSVATDHRGNALVTGTTNGSLGGSDPTAPAFLAKFDSDGNRIWIQQFHPDARFVAVDSHGHSLVAGTSSGSVHLIKFAP